MYLSYSADKLIISSSVSFRNTLQGLPTAITPAGISLFTTLPAAIMLPFPIVTPPHTVTLAPIHTSSSIVIGFEVPIPSDHLKEKREVVF